MTKKNRWSHGPTLSAIGDLLARTKHLFWKLGVVVPVMVLVTACGGPAQTTTASSALSVGYSGALPVETQLIAGSLFLEDTDLAISTEQAPELLLLWRAFRSLSNSDTSAQAEIDALINQIEETMSVEQIEAISAMKLTSDDLAVVLQQVAAPSMASAGSTTGTGSSAVLGPGAGGFVIGSGPGPGGGDGMALLAPSAGQGTILSAASTEIPSQNLSQSSRSSDRTAIRLVDTLITLLETRADA
jgi:hypothetical protein